MYQCHWGATIASLPWVGTSEYRLSTLFLACLTCPWRTNLWADEQPVDGVFLPHLATRTVPLFVSTPGQALWLSLSILPRQVMNPVAQAVAAGAWMTCVPRSSSLSPPRPLRWTRTGEKRNLRRRRRRHRAASPFFPGLWSAWSSPCRDYTDNRRLWSNETAF